MKLPSLKKPQTRRYLYRVTGSALAVAAVYGVINGEQAAALLVLAAAVCGVADRNVND